MVDTPRPIAYLQNSEFQDGQATGSITPSDARDFIVTMRSRTPNLRPTDPEYGAVGDGASHPLSGFYPGATTPALLAATTVAGATPYAWASNANYGLTFTKTANAATASGAILHLGSVSGDPANPMKFLVVGMLVTGTNIPANTTISSIAFTSGTPNAIDGPLAGTATMNASVTGGGVSNGATLTFSYSSTMMQNLEMDFIGVQSAEYASGLLTNGGCNYVPSGSYLMSRPLLRSVVGMLIGDEFGSSLVWPVDLGYGVWAVVPPDRTNSGPRELGSIRDISMLGPGNGTTMGVAGCHMHGLALGENGYASRVFSQGFYSGCNLLQDHQQCISCYFQNNFYNLYFAPLNGSNNGDQSFIDCYLDGPTFASVAVAGTNQCAYALFERCHCGFGPYAIYKETGAVTNFLIASLFSRLSCEACGNGAFYDENAAGLIDGCTFFHFDWALDSSNAYEITSRTTYAMLRCGNLSNCEFAGELDPYTTNYNRGTHPLTTSIILTQQSLSNTKFRNAGTLVGVGSATFPSVTTGNAIVGADVLWDAFVSSGTFRTCNGAITANTFVSNGDFGLAIAPSATNLAIIGMAYYAVSGSIGTACLAVQNKGLATAATKHLSTDVITAGKWLQIFSNTVGTVVTFNSGARTCTVGTVWTATSSGQTSLFMEIDIKGP